MASVWSLIVSLIFSKCLLQFNFITWLHHQKYILSTLINFQWTIITPVTYNKFSSLISHIPTTAAPTFLFFLLIFLFQATSNFQFKKRSGSQVPNTRLTLNHHKIILLGLNITVQHHPCHLNCNPHNSVAQIVKVHW